MFFIIVAVVIVALFAEQPVPTSWCQSGQWGQGGEAVMMSQVLTGLTEPGQELKKKKKVTKYVGKKLTSS